MTSRVIDQGEREKIKNDLHTNFLVEAGAGSGKTTSLVERMVNLIYTGTSQVHEMVAITFTRKAADELKMRFQSKLEQTWNEEQEDHIKYRLLFALQNIDRCFLGTVHSFCSKLLRERPIEANLDMNFKELEDSEDLILLEESWQSFLMDLMEYSPYQLQEMEDLGITIDELLLCLKDMKDYPDIEWVTDIVSKPDLRENYDSFMNLLKEANRAIPETEPSKGYDSLQKAIKQALQRSRFIDTNKDKDMIEMYELFNKNLKPTLNRWLSMDDAKFYHEKITSFFDVVIRPIIQRWKEYCHPKIVLFLKKAISNYQSLKKQRSLLNFQDLLIQTTKLLKVNPEVRSYFQEKYRFLLIDEFQDTDPIQAEMMFFLTSENIYEQVWTNCKPKPGALFVVGDPKQAIYRFRRADIDTYNRVKQLIEQHDGQILQLTMNFRTLNTVTDQLNNIFIKELPEEETIYQAAYRPLNAFHIDKGENNGGIMSLTVPTDYSRKEDVVLKDAENIAQVIKSYISQGYRAKDFMVLTRYNDGIITYASAIENLGIPVSISGEIIIGEMIEFQELSILLNTFLDGTDEISVVAVLRGIFFGISDDELYQWKRAKGYFSINSDIPNQLSEELQIRFQGVLSKLQLYQKWIRNMSPTAAIEKIIEDVGFYPLLLKNGHGKRAFKSLLQIIEALRKNEMAGNTTFKQSINRLDEMIFNKTVVANMEEEADAVRLMNVHKAKGLEAPIVFLAHPIKQVKPESFLSKHIKREDNGSKGFFSFSLRNGFHEKEIGIPLQWEIYKNEELQYLKEEEVRILYVAATRAEKALIISSCGKNNNKNPWSKLLEMEELNEVERNELEETDTVSSEEINLSHFHQATAQSSLWLDERIKISYDYWTPTNDKDYSNVQSIEREKGGGKDWGTLVHHVFEKVIRGSDVRNFIKIGLHKYKFPIEREEELLQYVERLKTSKEWLELQQSEVVLCEVPFKLKVTNGDSLYPLINRTNTNNHPFYVKGIIDLVYKCQDGFWKIIDFKTDRPKCREDLEILAKFYSSQLEFYKVAWEQMTAERVKETRLMFVTYENM